MAANPDRNNSFDLIRHAAALMVLISHHSALSRVAVPKFLGIFSYGAFAVLIFFAISGYLVTRSFDRSSSFWSYFEKRLRRLFPGLIVCTALMVVILCGFMGVKPISEWLFSGGAYNSFMSSIWMEGMRDINKFSHDFKYPNAINGSLWTLRYEFFCYLIIPTSLIVLKSYRSLYALLIFAMAFQLYAAFGHQTITSLSRLTLLMNPFVVGGILYFTQRSWDTPKTKWFLIIASAIFVVAAPKTPHMQPFFYVALSILTVLIGLTFKETIIAGRFDISYGIYIYAFPVQQLVINKTSLGFYSSMAVSAVITVLIAILSWRLVEKRFISRAKSPRPEPASPPLPLADAVIH